MQPDRAPAADVTAVADALEPRVGRGRARSHALRCRGVGEVHAELAVDACVGEGEALADEERAGRQDAVHRIDPAPPDLFQ